MKDSNFARIILLKPFTVDVEHQKTLFLSAIILSILQFVHIPSLCLQPVFFYNAFRNMPLIKEMLNCLVRFFDPLRDSAVPVKLWYLYIIILKINFSKAQ